MVYISEHDPGLTSDLGPHGRIISLHVTEYEMKIIGQDGLDQIKHYLLEAGRYVRDRTDAAGTGDGTPRDTAPYDADATAVDEPHALPDGYPGGFPSDRLVAGYLNAPPPGGDDE